MKILLSILLTLGSLSSFALTRSAASGLLKEKGVELLELERKGMQTLMGEVTGHRSFIPFSQVQVLFTEREAILESEIEDVDFSAAPNLGSVISIRYNGQYISKQDVKGAVLRP